MTQLRILNVHHNELSALPLGIGKLASSLTTVHLHNNQLSVLPREVAFLTSLSTLTLLDNPLIHPPAYVAKQGVLPVRLFLMNGASGTSCAKAGVVGTDQPVHVDGGSGGDISSVSSLAAGQTVEAVQALLTEAEAKAYSAALKARGIAGGRGPLSGLAAKRGCNGCKDLLQELEEQGVCQP